MIGSVDDALAAEKEIRREIERLRREIKALESRAGEYNAMARKLCPHSKTYVDKVSAGTPRFRRDLREAHLVICTKCHSWVDDAPVAPEWHWD